MGAFIVKQPNGLYCRFSTVVDTVTHWNMTEEDYLNYRAEKAREDAKFDLENLTYTMEDVKDYFCPGNDSIEEFEEILKQMGDEEGLGEERIKKWKEWQSEEDDDEV